jgi:hypothetical protein
MLFSKHLKFRELENLQVPPAAFPGLILKPARSASKENSSGIT